ncbi:MAG: hypothetical protein OXC40_04865 [Proteobacteria bacterium]|nr:hypothetical protein [Pseudomonadota bacterium]
MIKNRLKHKKNKGSKPLSKKKSTAHKVRKKGKSSHGDPKRNHFSMKTLTGHEVLTLKEIKSANPALVESIYGSSDDLFRDLQGSRGPDAHTVDVSDYDQDKKMKVIFFKTFKEAHQNLSLIADSTSDCDQLNVVIDEEGDMNDQQIKSVGEKVRVFAGEAWSLIHKRREEDGWYENHFPHVAENTSTISE